MADNTYSNLNPNTDWSYSTLEVKPDYRNLGGNDSSSYMSDFNTLGIDEYLERAGGKGIFARLDAQEGLLNKELDKRVHVSHSTLSDRLDEGKEKDLLVETRNPGDHGNAKRYLLTKRGEEVKRKMESLGMVEAYDQFFEAYQKLEDGEDELKEWVADSGIDDPQWPPDHDAADGKRPY